MIAETDLAADASPSAALPPGGLVIPHRAAAIFVFSVVGAACGGLALLSWLVLRAAIVWHKDPEGELLLIVGLLLLAVCAALTLSAWHMATRDLQAMAAGRMDPAGRARTHVGRTIAMAAVLAGVALILAAVILALMGHFTFLPAEPPMPAETA